MAHDGDGKGPGYAMMWGAVAALFIGGPAIAAVLGHISWWGAAGTGLLVGGAFVWLMLTTQWDTAG